MKKKSLINVKAVALAITILSSMVFAEQETKFDLERNGDMVCKISYVDNKRDEANKVCYSIVKEVPEKIEVVKKAMAFLNYQDSKADSMTLEEFRRIGGAIVLEREILENISENYRRISLRNFAIHPEGIIEKDGKQFISFFIDIYWKGRAPMEGTLHAEGFILLPGKKVNKKMGDSIQESKEALSPIIDFTNFSDSRTEQNKDWLRSIETSARQIHFTAINGLKTNVDQETQDFLNNIVGPVLVGETFYVPKYSDIIEGVSKAFSEGEAKDMESVKDNQDNTTKDKQLP